MTDRTDLERFDRRLSAVERVVVDGERGVAELATLDSLVETVEAIEARVESQERRLAEHEAAVESIEGYVGSVEAVNEEVERRAATAVATVDRLERRLERLEGELDGLQGGILEEPEIEGERDGRGVDEGGQTDTPAGGDEDTEADSGTGAASRFEFGRIEGEPERAAAELLGDRSAPDGSATPADQREVNATLGGDDTHGTSAAGASGEATTSGPEDDRGDGGLLASLRSRLP